MSVAFPTPKMEIPTLNDLTKQVIMSAEGKKMVDGMENNWFASTLCIATQHVSKGTYDDYHALAKAMGKEIDVLKTEVFKEIGARRLEDEKALTGPAKTDKMAYWDDIKARVDNSIKSAKSVATNAIKYTDQILKSVTDGGHVLWRKDGSARGKTELQTLIKAAKSHAQVPKSDYEKALDAAQLFAKRLAVLDQRDRSEILALFRDKLEQFIADEDGEDEEPELEEAA